jgi:hypothetical protein
MLFHVPFVRAGFGQDARLNTLLLSAGLMPVEVVRTDDRTVVLRVHGGLLAGSWDQSFRDAAASFSIGATRKLANCTVTVTAVTGTGLASEIKYAFTVPLEDSSLRWVTWSEQGFIPFALPPPGGAVRLKPLVSF